MEKEKIDEWINKMNGHKSHELVFSEDDLRIYIMNQETINYPNRNVIIWCFKTSAYKDNWNVFPPSLNQRNKLDDLKKYFDYVWNSNKENEGKILW